MLSPPPSTERPDPPGRRFLIAAGTACYQNLPEDEQLPGVEEAVRLVAELFTGKLGYERVLPDLSVSPTADQLRRGLSRWLTAKDRRADDQVVIYYSGHGEPWGDDHYLLTADSSPENLAGTALASGDLAGPRPDAGPAGPPDPRHLLRWPRGAGLRGESGAGRPELTAG